MPQLLDAPARAIAAATVWGAVIVTAPWSAAVADAVTSPTQQVAQANAPTSQPAAKGRRSVTDRVEARIKRLHDDLKITPEQETQWNAVADAMREDGKAMQAIIAERRQNRASMTAVDDLRSYEKVAETHVQGLQKLIPAFDALYNSMSPDQKKNADKVFGQRGRGRRHGQQPPQQ